MYWHMQTTLPPFVLRKIHAVENNAPKAQLYKQNFLRLDNCIVLPDSGRCHNPQLRCCFPHIVVLRFS
jgi:hypothetical protein